jgi:hypothetical protein
MIVSATAPSCVGLEPDHAADFIKQPGFGHLLAHLLHSFRANLPAGSGFRGVGS